MSNFQTISPTHQGQPGTASILWTASTSDSLGTIEATGYLNDISNMIKANDKFHINYSDTSTFPLNTGESSTYGEFLVVYNAPNWSLSPLNTGLVGSLQTASVAITAAQFNGMYAAPVALISAPGANKIIEVQSMKLIMTFGSADFAAGGVVAAQYDSTVHGAGVPATNTEAAADFFAGASTVFNFFSSTVLAPFSTTVNKGLYLSNATGAFTTGDSTFVANILYRILATA